jgi:alpha-L-fucosidase
VAPYKEGRVCLTKKGKTVYAIHLADKGEVAPPARIALTEIRPKAGSTVRLLGFDAPVPWKAEGKGVVLEVPAAAVEKPPCKDAFVFRMLVE